MQNDAIHRVSGLVGKLVIAEVGLAEVNKEPY